MVMTYPGEKDRIIWWILVINAAFHWNTMHISRVLSTKHCHFARKPANARHFCDCKRGDMRPSSYRNCWLCKDENNKHWRSAAVMNVATWPSKQARCPSHFRTWSMSFQQLMVIEIHTFAWQLVTRCTDIDSEQAHNFDSIVSDQQIFGDRRSWSTKTNTHRSVTDETNTAM